MKNKDIIFRCDDVSINTDICKLQFIEEIILKYLPKASFLFGISIMVHDMSIENGIIKERIFPKILNAFSDFRVFYKVNKLGMPSLYKTQAKFASHGLVHVDHRLLTKQCQELSILTSCSIVKTNIFIPPFNKWNNETENICKENDIELIKFENGWKHFNHNSCLSEKTYFHTHDFKIEDFEMMLCEKIKNSRY